MRKHLLSMILLIGALVSCVYPFEPELNKETRKLVIEGDIVLGDITVVKLSYMAYLDERSPEPMYNCEVKVQDSAGNEYLPVPQYTSFPGSPVDNLSGIYYINTSIVPPEPQDMQYRLYVKLRDGREYVSEWQTPRKAPEVDAVTHELDEATGQVCFNLSVHSNDGEQYFRWYFDEDWEYMVYYKAEYYYQPPQDEEDNPFGYLLKFENGQNTRYCWKTGSSTALYFTSTKDLSADTVTEKNFYRINRDNQKLSVLYAMNVKVESLSEDAYRYWNNMFNNSENVGNLFAPIPSEVRGNIHSLSDPDELVLGYINVSTVSQKRIFVDNDKTGYYDVPWKLEEDEVSQVIAPEDWKSAYFGRYRMRPVSRGEGMDSYWAPIQCVDCRSLGGTKNKPSWWPNNHK